LVGKKAQATLLLLFTSPIGSMYVEGNIGQLYIPWNVYLCCYIPRYVKINIGPPVTNKQLQSNQFQMDKIKSRVTSLLKKKKIHSDIFDNMDERLPLL